MPIRFRGLIRGTGRHRAVVPTVPFGTFRTVPDCGAVTQAFRYCPPCGAETAAVLHPNQSHTCGDCQTTSKGDLPMTDETTGCRRGCPEGDCYCSEMTYAEANGVCGGCGGHDGECYCGED